MKNIYLVIVAGAVFFAHSFVSAKGHAAHSLAKHQINTKEDARRILHKVLYCIKTEVGVERPALRAAVVAQQMLLENVLEAEEIDALLSCVQGKLPPHAHNHSECKENKIIFQQ